MSMIIKLIEGGLLKQGGWREINLTPQDKDFIELGIRRTETGFGRKLTPSERDVYYAAFCSALTVAGQIMRGGEGADLG